MSACGRAYVGGLACAPMHMNAVAGAEVSVGVSTGECSVTVGCRDVLGLGDLDQRAGHATSTSSAPNLESALLCLRSVGPFPASITLLAVCE